MDALLAQAERGKPGFYKKNLPIPFVLEQKGVSLSAKGDRLVAPCPFHADKEPSLDVWLDGEVWRWGCFPCGKGGDVLDLLGEFGTAGFGAQMAEAGGYYDELPSDYKVSIGSRSASWDEKAAQTLMGSREDDISAFVQELGLSEDPGEDWRLGVHDGQLIIPYYNREGTLVAYKHRRSGGKAVSASGSSLRGTLYGEWRDRDPSVPVLLCEGESDAWAAWGELGNSVAILSVPGAGMNPSATGLDGRKVTLAFDGDEAGRRATRSWAAYLLAQGCLVDFLAVPEGQDLRSVPSIRDLPSRVLKPAPDGIKEVGDFYARPGKDTHTMLTNWRLEPIAELTDSNGQTSYRGTIVPSGREVVLSSYDLSTKNRIVSWCSRYGLAWMGTDKDAQTLLAYLQALGPYLPSGTLVDCAGLHGHTFVWPGSSDPNFVYNPPQHDVHLDQRLTLMDADWTVMQIDALLRLHEPEVMDPIMGWLAAAPLRSTVSAFPILAVTGSSGSGKTTLLQTVVRAFSGADISTNLTSTTKHALASFLACTNAFPVWFDEYRPGARKDTQVALEQLLRDAYTGQISAKGGLGEHWSEVSAMRTDAPIIVSGEDTFIETSHTERMVNMALPSQGKNPDVLQDVRSWGNTGLPRAYLSWLTGRLLADDLPTPTTAGPKELPDRQRINLGIVAWGWELLDRFCHDNGLRSLGEPNLSLVTEVGLEVAQHNPIKDALLWAVDELDAVYFLQESGGRMYVRPESFVSFVSRHGVFVLPGKASAVRRYLTDQYGAIADRYPFAGRESACLSFDIRQL